MFDEKQKLSQRLVLICAELAKIEKEAMRKEAEFYSVYKDEISSQYELVADALREVQVMLNVPIDLLIRLEK